MKLREKDNLTFVTREQCTHKFFKELIENTDKIYELATNHKSMVEAIHTGRLKSFPIRRRD